MRQTAFYLYVLGFRAGQEAVCLNGGFQDLLNLALFTVSLKTDFFPQQENSNFKKFNNQYFYKMKSL
jgi:hypothetical protein